MNETLETGPDWPLRAILAVSFLFSLCCLVKLWRDQGSILAKIFWSFFVFVPLLGPLFFFVIYQPPSVKREGEQAEPTRDVDHLS
jgi:hypothetical protein